MTLNGKQIDWTEEWQLPDYCYECPFWYGGTTSVPGISGGGGTNGICGLRNMNKDRYADAPKACRNLFRKCLKYPADENLVIVLKD